MSGREGNHISVSGNVATVLLKNLAGKTSGEVYVDADDAPLLLGWTVVNDGRYPVVVRVVDGRKERLLLRKLVAGDTLPKWVEHINGNKYDCRKSNMRSVHHEGMRNKVIKGDGFSIVVIGGKGKGKGNERYAKVDTEDLDKLKGWRWSPDAYGYAHGYKGPTGDREMIKMHRLIMDAPPGLVVDHINHDKLDNRKSNLRLASCRNNAAHRKGLQFNNSSGYVGVSWFKLMDKWRARIKVNQKEITLGYFDDKLEAAKAYNKAAVEYNGEFATLNTIP